MRTGHTKALRDYFRGKLKKPKRKSHEARIARAITRKWPRGKH